MSSFAQRGMPLVAEVLCQLVRLSVWCELVLGNVMGTSAVMEAMSAQMRGGVRRSELRIPKKGLCTVKGLPENAEQVRHLNCLV